MIIPLMTDDGIYIIIGNYMQLKKYPENILTVRLNKCEK